MRLNEKVRLNIELPKDMNHVFSISLLNCYPMLVFLFRSFWYGWQRFLWVRLKLRIRSIAIDLQVESLRFLVFKTSSQLHLFETPVNFQGFLFDKNLRKQITQCHLLCSLECAF
jgi:hypothetical protein